ncbi:MAG: tetratricopeptide repeat protein [Ardenticatenaceae bacterium]|nr:tetratricopeptide repeat protein [Ardenticatenaceae bacterium]
MEDETIRPAPQTTIVSEPTLWQNYIFPLILSLAVFTGFFWVFPLIQEPMFINIGRSFIVLIGGILPSVMYRYFTQERLPTFFKEYKQNLRRLGLPENAQQYKDKFDAVYGAATQGSQIAPFNSPVFIATIITFIGWTLVFYPIHPSVAGLTPNPSPFAYGFLGAYVFGIGSLVRQFVTDDLQPRYYASLTVRFLTVFALSWLVYLLLPESTQREALLTAFFVGLFPATGLRLVQRAVTAVIGMISSGFNEPLPLSQLDGLNAYHEDRLLLEGIENMQNLASANTVDLMLRTRFTVEQLIDWMDQAVLQIHTRDRFDDFRRSGLRTATDFMDAYEAKDEPNDKKREEWRGKLAALLNSHNPAMANNTHTTTLIETIHYALQRDPNLFQIRYWRDHEFEALPEDIEAERTKADLKLMQNLPDEAIAVYDKLINKFPKYHALRLYRGLAYASKGEYVKAIDDYNTVIKSNLTNTDWDTARQAYLYRGRAQLALGDVNQAAQNYSDALKKFNSGFPEAQMDLAAVQLTHLAPGAAKIEEGVELYDEAIKNLTAVIASEFNTAEALANRGAARYQRAKAHQPSLSETDYHQAIEQARKDLQRALRLKPSLISFYINLAVILSEWGEVEEQEKVLTSALAQLEANPDANYAHRVRLERGYLYHKQERYREAIDDFKIATRIDPNEPTAFLYLGKALKNLELYDEAQRAFAHAISLNPGSIEGHEELGRMHFILQRYEEAKDAYVDMLALARETADRAAEARAHLGLGRTYNQLASQNLADWTNAKRELETAVNLTGENEAEIYAQAIFELGIVAFNTNQLEDAIRHFTDSAILFEVYGKARASANAYYYLGQTHKANAHTLEARDALQTALKRLNAVFVPNNTEDQSLDHNIRHTLATLAPANGHTQPVSEPS